MFPTRHPALILSVAAVLVVGDLVVKQLAVGALADGRSIDLPLISLRLAYNTGAAFSMGDGLPVWMVAAASGAVIAAGAVLLVRHAARLHLLTIIGGTVVLGGGLGNLIDRLDGRGVVDYLHTGWFPTFNAADVLITLGVGLIAIGLSLTRHHPFAPNLPPGTDQ